MLFGITTRFAFFWTTNAEVRNANVAWITPGDVLAEVIKRLTPQPPDLEEILYGFLQKELLSDEFVNLEQAGHDVSERIPLASVFVDLPTRHEGHHGGAHALEEEVHVIYEEDAYEEDSSEKNNQGFINQILNVSAEHLDPKSLAINAIGQSPDAGASQQAKGRFVLIGGPGQGKTTVGQFICQIFRASIISQRPSHTLPPETQKALSAIRTHCAAEDINVTPVPRFPFRIVLNEYATALSEIPTSTVNSVFSFLARQIYKRTDRSLSGDDIRRWFAEYPNRHCFRWVG